MENSIENLVESLRKVRETLVNPEDVSTSDYSVILEEIFDIKKWIASFHKIAVDSIANGEPCPGFKVSKREYRKIVDNEGAIAALAAFNPEIVKLCTITRVKNITELHKVLSREEFNNIVVPFTETVVAYTLHKDTRDNIQ